MFPHVIQDHHITDLKLNGTRRFLGLASRLKEVVMTQDMRLFSLYYVVIALNFEMQDSAISSS